MFINDRLVYLQLQKTACTHIAKVLHTLSPGQFRAKHSPLLEDPRERLVIGSVRNPWDWYVSLWAYGCLGRGAIHAQLTMPPPAISYRLVRQGIGHPAEWRRTVAKVASHNRKDHLAWQEVYADADDPALFRRWLKQLLSDRGKVLLMESYPHLYLRKFAGLLTFRFLHLHVDHDCWTRSAPDIKSPRELVACYQQNGIIQRFIRIEQLDHDLADILVELGIPFREEDLRPKVKTNTSKHRNFEEYYDDEAIKLVHAHDFLIVDQFGYRAPVPAKALA